MPIDSTRHTARSDRDDRDERNWRGGSRERDARSRGDEAGVDRRRVGSQEQPGTSRSYKDDRVRHEDDRRRGDYRRDDSSRRDERGSRGDRTRSDALPPPPRPPSRSGFRSGDVSPLPTKDLSTSGRTTPNSAPRKGPPVSQNPLVAELLRQGKLLAKQVQGSGEESHGAADVELEAGELPPAGPGGAAVGEEPAGPDGDVPRRKRKHSPIVWNPDAHRKQARASSDSPVSATARADVMGGGLSLLERAQMEAAALKAQAAGADDFDPDAPAAIKSSPSFSGSPPDERLGHAGGVDEAANGSSYPVDLAGGDQHAVLRPASRGLASRWLTAEDDEEEAGPLQGPAPGGRGEESAGPSYLEAARGRGASSPGIAASQGRGGSPAGGAVSGVEGGEGRHPPGSELGSPIHLNDGPRAYDMRAECRDVNEFEKLGKISEGTYGVVYKAREKSSGRIVALKRVKMEHETSGFPITSVREISILLNFHHPNIVRVEEVVVAPRHPDQIYMVMEYMDHDLKSLMEDKVKYSQPFSAGQVKCLMQQLLEGIAFLHEHWVLHRDLKTSNILYNRHGDLKLCDFGMARQYGEPLGTYTHNVVTLWYRAPELLFGAEQYSTGLDMWSVGCIMGEVLTGKPLLPGQGEFDQIDKMVQLLGTPTTDDWPGLAKLPNFKKINLKQMPSTLRQRFTGLGVGTTLTEAGFDLLSRMLAWDPEQRITASEALQHRWFREAPLPVARVLMPTFAPRKAG